MAGRVIYPSGNRSCSGPGHFPIHQNIGDFGKCPDLMTVFSICDKDCYSCCDQRFLHTFDWLVFHKANNGLIRVTTILISGKTDQSPPHPRVVLAIRRYP